jgi:predicted nucleotidyltransferase
MLTPLNYSHYRSLIECYLGEIQEKLGHNLLSVTLFGSVVREKAVPNSDVDLLTLVKEKNCSVEKEIIRINVASYNWPEMLSLREKGIRTKIYNIVKTEGEIKENPLILLDILEDGKLLYDPQGKMKRLLQRLKKRLKILKAERVVLKDGKWYWDLKPDWKMGEIIEIKL